MQMEILELWEKKDYLGTIKVESWEKARDLLKKAVHGYLIPYHEMSAVIDYLNDNGCRAEKVGKYHHAIYLDEL
jgi:hypothetical protein